jgi:hypothetical protein
MTVTPLSELGRFASALQDGLSPAAAFGELDEALAATFGPHRLFTILAYDAEKQRLCRIYSSDHEVNPVGFMKRVTDSVWTNHVLRQGKCLMGSTKDDLKKVFSEYEMLWAIGCGSILNVPVRQDGVTIATLNLLGREHLYDDFDSNAATVFAQLAIRAIATRAADFLAAPDRADMQTI